jgi:hypothetical protein
VSFTPLLASVLLLSISIYLSVLGSRSIALTFGDETESVLASGDALRDSLETSYGARVALAEASITALESNRKHRWGGLLSASENRQILNIQERIARLEAEKSAAVTAALSETSAKASKSFEAALGASWVLVAVSSVNELLIVLCAWFPWYFSYKVRHEKKVLTAGSGLAERGYIEHLLRVLTISDGFLTPFNPVVSSFPGISGSGHLTDSVPDKCSDSVPDKKTDKKACKKCGAGFEAKHWAAKYCGESCRIAAWEERTGRKFIKGTKR